jgi:hypothetical protein
MLIKIYAFTLIGYLKSGWNQFDFFIVCSSIIDIILNQFGKSFLTVISVGP